MKLPEAFENRMKALLGDEYPAFAATYEQDAVKALHLNEKAITEEAFRSQAGFAVTPLAHVGGGFTFALDKPGNHPLHHAGAFYLQDPSAMATVAAAEDFLRTPGLRCLDVCASPGGKSAQIASLLGEGSFLVSNEIMPARCKTLAGNMERMGFADLLVTNADTKRLAAWFPAFFDFVLADVPCSGEGMFRKYPESVSEWNEKTPAYCAERQREILTNVMGTLAPGGRLLYSTCTFAEEENEGNVAWLLETYPDLRLLPVSEALQAVSAPAKGFPEARRMYPHLCPGEGQFFALFEKAGTPAVGAERDPAFADGRKYLSRAEIEAVTAFLDGAVEKNGDLNLCKLGDRIASVPFAVPDHNVFAAGITLGTVEKNRLVPHHQLFKALGRRFLRKIELAPDDPRLLSYLRGAEIDADSENGWAVVTTLGIPVGGAKVVDGRAKNHYPKGLRIL